MTVALLVIAVVCAVGWWISNVCVSAMLHYMKKKGYTLPTSEEVGECVRWAVKKKLSKKS